MPYRWSETPQQSTLQLWAHQSMSPSGFVWFIGSTAIMATFPLLAVLGTPVAWILMACFLAAVAAVWRAISANQKARNINEVLRLNDMRLQLRHQTGDGNAKSWEAEPYWVKVSLRDDGPVENYLTLRSAGREVELGAFLTPDERQVLFEDLSRRLGPQL